MESTYRAHYNFNDKTQSIDFNISDRKVSKELKQETAIKLIQEKNPEYKGKTIVISKIVK